MSGDLDLGFLLTYASDDPGAAFRTSLLFANVPDVPAVPEPGAGAVFSLCLLTAGGLIRWLGRKD